RHVGRALNDVKALEMNPQGMRGIRKMPACKSVGCKKIAELIVPARLGHAKNGVERDPCRHHEEPHKQDCENLMPRKPGEKPLGSTKSRCLLCGIGRKEYENSHNNHEKKFQDWNQRGSQPVVEFLHRGRI